MSNRLFQGIIHQTREAIDRTVGVIDETMTIIACSDLGRIGATVPEATTDVFMTQEPVVIHDCTYHAFGSRPHSEYALFVEGSDDNAARYAALLAVSLTNIKQYYDEKYDRGNFVKNVILVLLCSLDFAGSSKSKTFFCAAMAFHFWHNPNSPLCVFKFIFSLWVRAS